jgi:hypothetical protein
MLSVRGWPPGSVTCLADLSFTIVQTGGKKTLVIVSAMGSHETSPVKVTDLILNMIEKAANKDDGFLLDLAALQEKHESTAKKLLGEDTPAGKRELTTFTEQLLNDISNLKSMLQAISIGAYRPMLCYSLL